MTDQDPNRTTTPPPPPSEAPTVAWTRPTDRPTEDLSTPPAAEPVRTSGGPSRARWGIALLVTVLVVGVAAVAAVLLTGQSAPSSIVGYAPAGSTLYGEVRLDFPGDQKQQLGDFLSKFPGFRDQSTLDAKIDDVLDRVVRAMTDEEQNWTTDIKPWFGGEMGFALAQLPPPDDPEQARGLAILSVTDAAKARAWFDDAVSGQATTEVSHNGVQLVVVGEGDHTGAMAIHNDRTMLVGDEASVRAAIDSGGKTSFATEGVFKDALATLEGEGLGYMYVDLKSYMSWFEDVAQEMPGASAIPIPPMAAEMVPDWLIFRLRAEGDAMAMEVVAPHVEAASVTSENRASTLAGHVPPSTIVFMDGHDAGASIQQSIELAKAQDPEVAKQIEAFEEQAALIGGIDGLIGWWGDAAIAVAEDGGGVHGGILIQPKDRADAERILGVFRAAISLGGGSDVSVREEDHNGATITIFDLGDASSLAALFGMMSGVPLDPDMPSGERVELAFAVTDDVVVLAASPSFARAVLDAGAGDSLADDARYQAQLAKVGSENTSSLFVDLAAVRTMIERLGADSPEMLDEYERDIKPYLLPLDAIIQATVRDGDVNRTRSLITVSDAE